MLVTPVNRFGKYRVGDVFEFPDKAARIFIKARKLAAVEAGAPTYQTRAMQAEPVAAIIVQEAPYGLKADGTPRKRPGRPAAEQ